MAGRIKHLKGKFSVARYELIVACEPEELQLYLFLKLYAIRKHDAFPGQRTIKGELGWSWDKITHWVKRMEEKGRLRIDRDNGNNNLYDITWYDDINENNLSHSERANGLEREDRSDEQSGDGLGSPQDDQETAPTSRAVPLRRAEHHRSDEQSKTKKNKTKRNKTSRKSKHIIDSTHLDRLLEEIGGPDDFLVATRPLEVMRRFLDLGYKKIDASKKGIEDMEAWVADLQGRYPDIDIAFQSKRWYDYHSDRGKPIVSHKSSFLNWIRNEERFNQKGA